MVPWYRDTVARTTEGLRLHTSRVAAGFSTCCKTPARSLERSEATCATVPSSTFLVFTALEVVECRSLWGGIKQAQHG